MLITIHNVRSLQMTESLIHRVRIIAEQRKPRTWAQKFWFNLSSLFLNRSKYKLLKGLDIELRNGQVIHIPEGFIWDLSSVPRLFWGLLPPDGDFEFAALLHDYLYVSKMMSRERADVEMFAWSKAVSGTSGRNTWGDVDNWIRYAAVRGFGWTVYNRRKTT